MIVTMICLAALLGSPAADHEAGATATSKPTATAVKADESSAWKALNSIIQTHRYPERGRLMRQTRPDYKKQAQALEKALPQTAGTTAEPHALLHLGSTYFELERFEESLATFEDLKKRFPKHGLCTVRALDDATSLSPADTGIRDARGEIEIRKIYQVQKLPEAVLDETQKAVFTTSLGDFEMMFYKSAAPQTVANFEKLIKSGYYHDTYVHRVLGLRNFIAGCPKTREGDGIDRQDDGSGSPGYDLPLEFSTALHKAGAVSMVEVSGAGRAHGSQFTVCVNEQPQFNNKQAVFAKVTGGLDVIKKISQQLADGDANPYERIWIRGSQWIELR